MTTLTPSQQAEHDEVMELADSYAESFDYGENDRRLPRFHLSAAIAQLCAKPDSAEQVPVLESFKKWKGYDLPELNSEGRFDENYLHREFVAYKAAFNIAQQAPIHDYDKLREQFEKWCWNDTPESANFPTGLNSIGDYKALETKGAWLAWQYLHEQSYLKEDIAALQSQLSQAQEENARLKNLGIKLERAINLNSIYAQVKAAQEAIAKWPDDVLKATKLNFAKDSHD